MYYIVHTVTVVVYASSNGSPSLCYFSQHHLLTVPCDQEEAIGVWRTLTLVIASEKQIQLCRAGHCFYFTAINNNYYNLSWILCLLLIVFMTLHYMQIMLIIKYLYSVQLLLRKPYIPLMDRLINGKLIIAHYKKKEKKPPNPSPRYSPRVKYSFSCISRRHDQY